MPNAYITLLDRLRQLKNGNTKEKFLLRPQYTYYLHDVGTDRQAFNTIMYT